MCTVKEDTRVTERTSTLIDNILIDVNRVKEKTTVFETGLSDHKAQEIVFKEFYIKTKKIKSHLLQRVYNKKNTETFKSFLETKDWTSIKTADNAKDAFEIFFKNVTSSFLAAFPKTKVKIKKHKKETNWITKGIKTSRNTLHFLSKEYRKNSSLKNKYKKYKKVYLEVLKLAKWKENRAKIIKATNKQKEMWKIVKEIENKEIYNKSNVLESLKFENNNDSKWEKTNKICKFFVDIGKNDTANITEAEKFCTVLYNHKTMYLYPTTVKELNSIIKKIKKKSTSGPDDIPYKIIHEISDVISEPLKDIINQSLETGKSLKF